MIYLQRHGESVNNLTKIFTCRRLDPRLTELGRRQIQNLIPYYSAKGINQIFSSPSKRAIESAEILSSGLGVEFRTDDCLLEVDVGILEGESEQDHELLAQFHAVMDNWLVEHKNTRFLGGESFEEVQSRLSTVQSLMSLGQTVVVGHCALFAVFLGTRGGAFTKVEDLFLSRGGMATYDQQARTWRIETVVEPPLRAGA
jgi:broad specificity phosphatase PhoE